MTTVNGNAVNGRGTAGAADPAGAARSVDPAEVINAIEGYLLWEGEKRQAQARARALCGRMPWLTDSQRIEVERLYVEDHLNTSKAYLKRVARRSAELRAEYEGVYRVLRRRLLAAFLSGAAAVGTVAAVIALR
ncbi:hypothetical protein [Streptomyces sp. SAJ15]|uniref:hypothetical protein n=1 Tax=Streptomyces sp. SAJ15 TaxID=2011095 RepID=UPI0021B1A32A|nr:hypothetical protein [Streptomyces sp. SAJ15]